jgi:hypothetical protein
MHLQWPIKTDPGNIDAMTADLYLTHGIRHTMLTTENQKWRMEIKWPEIMFLRKPFRQPAGGS